MSQEEDLEANLLKNLQVCCVCDALVSHLYASNSPSNSNSNGTLGGGEEEFRELEFKDISATLVRLFKWPVEGEELEKLIVYCIGNNLVQGVIDQTKRSLRIKVSHAPAIKQRPFAKTSKEQWQGVNSSLKNLLANLQRTQTTLSKK